MKSLYKLLLCMFLMVSLAAIGCQKDEEAGDDGAGDDASSQVDPAANNAVAKTGDSDTSDEGLNNADMVMVSVKLPGMT